jgi:F420-dependent oxidoreductase-like protein
MENVYLTKVRFSTLLEGCILRAEIGVKTSQGRLLGHYENLRRIWVEADRLGFHSGWLFDHLFELPLFGPSHEPCLEAWTLLSALSKETSKLRLGVTCLCVPYRNPAMLAKMSSTLDVISDGRFELGIGAGWAKTEHESYGIPFDKPRQRVEKLEEAVMIIKKMWTEENPSFEGKHYRIDGAVCNPKPLQKPRPPIWIGGEGERFTLRAVANQADGCNFIGSSPSEYKHKLDVLAKHCDLAGRKIGDVRKSWQGLLIVGSNDAELKSRMQLATQSGHPTRGDLRSHAITGTPEQCTQQIGEYLDLGVDRFMLSFPEAATDLSGLRLFAQEILPNFK